MNSLLPVDDKDGTDPREPKTGKELYENMLKILHSDNDDDNEPWTWSSIFWTS